MIEISENNIQYRFRKKTMAVCVLKIAPGWRVKPDRASLYSIPIH